MAQIATVMVVNGSGTAVIVDANGNTRPAVAGAPVMRGETVRTTGGARVELMMEDGDVVAINPNQTVRVDENMAQGDARPTPQEGGVASQAIDQVLQALEQGGDLTEELEAAAAGLGGGGGDAEGGGIVQLLRISEGTDGQSYNYDTGLTEPTFEFDNEVLAVDPVVPPPVVPEVNVGVTIGIPDVETDPDGNGLISGDVVQGTVSSLNVIEGTGEGTKPVTFLITLSEVTTVDVTVTYTLVGDTATLGDDFFASPTTGTVTIPAGFIGFSLTVQVNQDSSIEGNETFNIVLSNPIGATLTNDTATVTIVDDDIAVSASDEEVDETGGLDSVSGQINVNYAGSGTTPVIALSATGASWDADNSVLEDDGGFWKIEVDQSTGEYTFTQLKAMDHPDTDDANDAIKIDVTATVSTSVDVDGTSFPSSDSTTFTVTVLDDGPTAVDDNGGTLVEDGETTQLMGNVLSNDESGADGPAAFVSWDGVANADAMAELNTYGTLTLNDNGTWTYVLDSTRAATQALNGDFDETFQLTYTMKDADGDEDTAVLSVRIQGAADDAEVIVSLQGADAIVYEAGLTSVENTSETDTGTFRVTATDGIKTVTVGGATFTLAELQAFTEGSPSAVIDTGEGELVITGFSGDALGGDISFSYTLKDAETHTQPANDTTLTDEVDLEVDGQGGSNATGTLKIDIIDDVPTVDVTLSNATLAKVTVDETALGVSSTVVSLAGAFGGTADAGADGQASLTSVYTLAVGAVASGVVDVATGQTVLLEMSGDDVRGYVMVGETKETVFTVSVDEDTGEVTLTQLRALDHPDDSNDNDAVTLAAGAVTLTREDTIVDNDGDEDADSATVNIGGALQFLDDGPNILTVDNLVVLNKDGATKDGVWSFTAGNDGLSSLLLTLTDSSLEGVTTTYDSLTNTLIGKLDGADYFSITLNANGTYTFTILSAGKDIINTDTAELGGAAGGNPQAWYLEELVGDGVTAITTDVRFTAWHESEADVQTLGTVNSNAQGLGVNTAPGTSALPISTGEFIRLEFLQTDGIFDGNVSNGALRESKSVDSVTLGFVARNGAALSPTDVTIRWTLVDAMGNTLMQEFDRDVSGGQLTLEAPDGYQIIQLDVWNKNASEAFLIDSVTVTTITEVIQPDDVQLTFEATITDGDGDSSSYSFNVGVDAQGSATVGSEANNVILGTNAGETITAGNTGSIIDGGAGDDTITGGAGNDILIGGAGDDILIGGAGDDILIGGAGSDIMTGGEGADVFKWSLADTDASEKPVDTITDFTVGDDTLDIGDLLSQPGSTLEVFEVGGTTTVTVKVNEVSIQEIVLQGYVDGNNGADIKAALESTGKYDA